MKRIVPLLVVGILVLSGLGAASTQTANDTITETEKDVKLQNFDLLVTKPTFTTQDEFITINLDQSETFLSKSGAPMLPVITKTFDFPVGTAIKDVNVDMNYQRYSLDRKITPTPVFVPQCMEINPDLLEEKRIDETVYESAALYPDEQYKIKIGSGIKEMEHVIFVNVKCFPQYSPVNDFVNIPTQITIDIEYEAADPSPQNAEEYDLIIITHEVLEDEMQRLVDHKENMGLSTKLVTVNEIYDTYDGSADWEEVKMYLAEHVKVWDTKFVLLAGGHMGQTYDWWVPDFESNNWDPASEYGTWDEHYSSDLYFADVYYIDQYGNRKMETWDSNGNGEYAEGPDMPQTDVMDFYPDVHLGRLPIRYEWEADVVVDKIIAYETGADDSWFKKAVLAGGDGFPPERYGDIADPNAWEGEIVCDEFAKLLANRGVQSTKCYCSHEGDIKVNGAEDVYTEVSKGCGFVHLTGHACPFSLGSYEPGTGISPEPPLTAFYNGFDARQYDCGDKLPFMICEGCHNAQFNTAGQELIDFLFDEYDLHPDIGFILYHYEWIPHDVSSWFVVQKGGGAIGVIGNTALGLGGLNDGCTEFVGGWIMLRFAEGWGVEGLDHMGAVWTYGINGYIDNFDVSFDMGDRKTIEERALLGDPSVLLGGYGSSLSEDEQESEEEPILGPVSALTPTWSAGNSWTYALDTVDIDVTTIEDRSLTLQLSAGDIALEVTDVRADSYVCSLTSENIDVSLGGIFDFRLDNTEDLVIPSVSFDNIQINGELILNKESLGIMDANIGLNIDLIENLDNIEDMLGMQFPSFIDVLAPYLNIPVNLELNMGFEDPFDVLAFPLENNKMWGFPANKLTLSIDGSIESVWLRIANFVDKFIDIIPPTLEPYMPNIDISEILEDNGIETYYEIDVPEIPAAVLEYHKDTTALFEVKGSENVNTQAGTFNAAKISILKDNGKIYYSEDKGNIVQIVGHISDYVPIINDIKLELKE